MRRRLNPDLQESISSTNQPMHFSVGALIRRNGNFLLIDRKKPPKGLAGLAGHIDEGEAPEEAVAREVLEESGLTVTSSRLLDEEELTWNRCSKGVSVHYWYLFECDVEGHIRLEESEATSIGWYPQDLLAELPLEPAWRYWFLKLKLI